jgi:hypothetical protein
LAISELRSASDVLLEQAVSKPLIITAQTSVLFM